LSVVLLAALCIAPAEAGEYRFDRSKLNIGVWRFGQYLRDEVHVRELADCGVDIACMTSGENDAEILDLFQKYGIGCFFARNGKHDKMPYWGIWRPRGQMHVENPISAYEAAAPTFRDHPAIWALIVCDEPNALDFPHIGKVVKRLQEIIPGNRVMFMDLNPCWGELLKVTETNMTKTILGTRTYREYIDSYCRHVPVDYISYDFYPYSQDEKRMVPQWFDNLGIVADACRRNRKSLWIAPQVNSYTPDRWTSENQLRFQAFSAMAYGVEQINWACWNYGWWTNQVIDAHGARTQQYDKLKKVNAEIHRLGPRYMSYRNIATRFSGYNAVDAGELRDLRDDCGSPLVIGEMISRSGNGTTAVFVFAADDPFDVAPKDHRVVFRCKERPQGALGPDGEVPVKATPDGRWMVNIRSNSCVLIW